MNGHGQAESLAFSLADISRQVARPISDADDAPFFIFAAGWGCGERDLQRRLARTWGSESTLDPLLITAMGWQLVRSASCPQMAPEGAAERAPNAETFRQVACTQAAFLRGVCRAATGACEQNAWGATWTGLNGEHTLYLRLLFPRARFVFLHRNPIDAFVAALRSMGTSAAVEGRDLSWAAGFAEQWCRLVASFELWHKEVDGILVGYEQAMAASPGHIEAYLGERLSPPVSAAEPENGANSAAQLRADEVALLVERTREMAARLGYTLTAELTRGGQGSAGPEPASAAPQVHIRSVQISCAVLVPAMRYIEPECEEALLELERRGYAVTRLRGCSSIDQGRNMLATGALDKGFEETLWVDADTGFDPDVVEKLRSHNVPVAAGICARKSPLGGLAVAPLPGTAAITMGEGGGLVEVLYAGTGFLLVRRAVYVTIQRRFSLPICDETGPRRAIPFFMPMLEDWGGRLSYLGEDYAFSRRARLCGYKIMADTSIRLWHIGMYRYGFEDAGNSVARLETYKYSIERPQAEDLRG
ncbi:MAG TPA: sulfotransferase [Pirellulales bacterium]|nr:sulfotransferase [Pirellulales bacterium]